ncbi:MAG: ABC transporter ATP-binding protein [Lachnospiraceae bacterium]|nr:ABC transporter ATP-binding protein [Lachnospiraceae bacterium]
MKAIETEKLTKYYGKFRGIIDLDLAVEQGEIFGFIGPNGAGKSTTIRTLLGLISPTSGGARILGKDIVRDKTAILREVGYLPSEAVFYPGMRVREILKLSADLRQKDCSARSAALCERLELDPGRKAEELSYGNRKKLAIICAVQSDPALLILDEPTGGLDPLMQREFFDIITERNKEGATVFLSSHILSEVQRHCHRAAIIREGRLIACDSVEALRDSNARRIRIEGRVDLAGLTGLKDLTVTEQGASFLYSGDMQPLLQRLAAGTVQDLNISEPDLEEIFLHYYGKGEPA